MNKKSKKTRKKNIVSEEDYEWLGEKTEMAYYAPEEKLSKINKKKIS
jgi:aspartate carbamoyltransferase regulatory subunit